jgi:type IV pilus assembly protein PilN
MIKINLLPSKKKPPKKVTDFQKQVILGSVIFIVVTGGMLFFWKYQTDRIAALERQKAAAEARIREQDNMLKEVKNVEDERKKVLEKIDIVQQLKKNQAGPVRLLDEISLALPVGVNILSLTEKDKNLSLEGDAFTNYEVVRFIDNLKASRFLSNVVLLETSQAKKEGIEFYKYKLQFTYKGL